MYVHWVCVCTSFGHHKEDKKDDTYKCDDHNVKGPFVCCIHTLCILSIRFFLFWYDECFFIEPRVPGDENLGYYQSRIEYICILAIVRYTTLTYCTLVLLRAPTNPNHALCNFNLESYRKTDRFWCSVIYCTY